MPLKDTSPPDFDFDRFLRTVCGAAQHATVTSLTLARGGHDLFDILDAVRSYGVRPRPERTFDVEITFATPDAKDFGLSIRRL